MQPAPESKPMITRKRSMNTKLFEKLSEIANSINSEMYQSLNSEGESEENAFWHVIVKLWSSFGADQWIVEFAGMPIWDSENEPLYELSDEYIDWKEEGYEYSSLKDHIEGKIRQYVNELNSFDFFKGKLK